MTVYEYRVAPAPRRLKRVKGTRSTAELFSSTLAEAINLAAREGWEYLRAESLPAEEPGGWFRRGAEVVETVLVFRRPREQLGPRLAAARDPDAPETDAPRLGSVERGVAPLLRREPRLAGEAEPPSPLRREPRLGGEGAADAPRPLRPAPRLGPADQA